MNKEFTLVEDRYNKNYYFLRTNVHNVRLTSDEIRDKESWLKILNLTEDKVTIKNH